jgi:ribosomal protein L37AE/L43A
MLHQCPCCSNTLLRHIRQGSIYWFCSDCRMEMPDLELVIHKPKKRQKTDSTNNISSEQQITKSSLIGRSELHKL